MPAESDGSGLDHGLEMLHFSLTTLVPLNQVVSLHSYNATYHNSMDNSTKEMRLPSRFVQPGPACCSPWPFVLCMVYFGFVLIKLV